MKRKSNITITEDDKKKKDKSVRIKTSTQAGKELATFVEPFYPHANPRIPDGEVRFSAGRKVEHRSELTLGGDGLAVFVLLPFFNRYCCMTRLSTQFDFGALELTSHSFDQYGHFQATTALEGTTRNVETFDHKNATEVERWRMVSAAMKLCCTNGDDHNDGWYETYQIPIEKDLTSYIFETVGGDINGTTVQGPPPFTGSTFANVQNVKIELSPLKKAVLGSGAGSNPNAVNNPSYRIGRLKDIHNDIFKVHPLGGDHPFSNVPEQRTMKDTMQLDIDNSVIIRPTNNIDPDIFDDHIDYEMTCRVVVVHGRSDANAPSRVLCHSTANYEFVFKEESNLSAFMSTTNLHPDFEAATFAHANNA